MENTKIKSIFLFVFLQVYKLLKNRLQKISTTQIDRFYIFKDSDMMFVIKKWVHT